MLTEHWNELAVDPTVERPQPNLQRFIELEDLGLYRVWAARDGKTLVGYVGFWVQRHLHSGAMTAVDDLYLLSAPYRKGLNGVRMFTTALAALKELGVSKVLMHEKYHHNRDRGGVGKILKRLGFELTDFVWARRL